MGYPELIEHLGFPGTLGQCTAGTISIPLPTYSSPPEWYGFPPALLPISSDGSGPTYLGLWNHFSEARGLSFVKMYVGLGREVVEIARSLEQFYAVLAVSGIVAADGITNQLREFASLVGLMDLERIDGVTIESGDDPRGLQALPSFENNVPLESCSELSAYDGGFPTLGNTSRTIMHNCSFELRTEWFGSWPNSIQRPDWLTVGMSKRLLFNRYLEEASFEQAWLTLNSTGWRFSQAAQALEELAVATNSEYLKRLVDCWVPLARLDLGGY